jgi:RES domain-containing protein
LIVVVRICKAKHRVFDGEGSRLAGGRWSHPGTPMVYTSDHIALAVLEVLVHLEQVPVDYVRIAATVPDELIEIVDETTLPEGWNDAVSLRYTKDYGTRWIHEGRSAVLSVPAVIVPQARNYLINPNHPDFGQITISAPKALRFDERLSMRR